MHALNASNLTFGHWNRNVLIKNDTSVGMVSLTGERIDLDPVPAGRLQASEASSSTDDVPRIRIEEKNDDGTVKRVVISRRASFSFFKEVDGVITRISTAPTRSQQITEVVDFMNLEFSKTVTQAVNDSAFRIYDVYCDSAYDGSNGVSDGTAMRPFTDVQTAANFLTDGDTVFLKGSFFITSAIELDHLKSASFFGNGSTIVGYATFDAANGHIFYQDSASTKSYEFNDLSLCNAGGYGIYTKGGTKITIKNCDIHNCGWSGTRLNTVATASGSWANGDDLGYNSAQSDLQAFWASGYTSNGGAMRIQGSPVVDITDNTVYNNLRGMRIQDCGYLGAGVVARNRSFNNIESGIYLASGTYGYVPGDGDGCENFTVYNNSVKDNANNGILVIGGINNIVSLNRVEGNWNAGVMMWNCSETRARDMDLDNNNRSQFNGIGNQGDAFASITIAGPHIRSNATYLAEVLDTTVQNTGLGRASEARGLQISSDLPGANPNGLPEGRPRISVDDCSFVNQAYCIYSEDNLDDLRLTISDCRYTQTTEANVFVASGSWSELPYSNLHVDSTDLDFSVDVTGSLIRVKENGLVIQSYGINELAAEAFGSRIRVKIKDSKRIQWDDVEVSNISIDGTSVNSVLVDAVNQLNDLFSNATGFTSTGNPVTSFVLNGNNLTLGLQDGTSYTVDVTTLGVDENKFVSSGALNGTNLVLTMNDSSEITINAANMVNASQLPARAQDWYISYGNRSGEEIAYASIVADIANHQPFYNGDFLEQGEEYVWTHDGNGTYILGVYTGAEETSDELEITYNAKWGVNFKFSSSLNAVRETSVGVDVASRYTSGYAISNTTVLALSYDNDNYLRLWDITSNDRILIGQTNTPLTGSNQIISMGGGNQPNAKFPVMIKRFSDWTIVHDFDGTEGPLTDGLNEDTVIKSNISISPGEQFMLNLDIIGRGQRWGLDYTGASSGVSNAHYNIHENLIYSTAEQITADDVTNDWTFDPNNTYYQSTLGGWWWRGGGNAGMLSIRYQADNSLELWSEDDNERIATKQVDLDGSDVHLFFGVAEDTPVGLIPSISKQTIGQGPQPLTTFAPDVSDQSYDITENAAINVQLVLDAGSNIASIWGAVNAPSWMTLNQATGQISGTAPAYTGTSADDYVVNMKVANALGGISSFDLTLSVKELVYTNTKSLKFGDGSSAYLGGNAALVTALERVDNGSGASEAWTFAFWYKGSVNNQGQTLLYFGANDTVNNGHIEIKQTNHNGLKRLRFRYGSNSNHLQLTTSSGSIDPTVWQHVMVTYDGGTTGVASGSVSDYYTRFKVFLNGVEQSTSNTHTNNGFSGSIVGENYRFGRLVSGNYIRDAYLNQLAIWDTDLSADISTIYNGGVTQDLSLLTGDLEPSHYYEIDTSVTTIPDLVGNAHFVGYNFSSTDLVDDAP